LVNGGHFVGSATVVAGISGIGKSVMGLRYLAEAGGRRGKCRLVITLDEPAAQARR